MTAADGTPVLSYARSAGYDEIVADDGAPRPVAAALWRHLAELGLTGLEERQRAAENEIAVSGVTFGTADDEPGAERPWAFDVVPRVLDAEEWTRVADGLVQRLRALNCFVADVYGSQGVLRDGIVPPELVVSSPNFRPQCVGARPPGGLWAHICGTDLVRAEDGTLYVLEDNLRVPSGAAYLLENRHVSKRSFPELFRSYSVEPVDQYIGRLGSMMASLAPWAASPRIVLLTPGVHNSAYYEHVFLAQQLGVDLVEGRDLVVLDDDVVYVRTLDGLERVDVVYRRVDDVFLDPEAFRRDSVVGVAGIMRAWKAGHVAIVNAPGTGVADDKGLYPYVERLVRYYLDEQAILPSVPTWRCAADNDRRYVLSNLGALVVKPSNESGGYGIVIGPQAGADALEHVRLRIESHPPGWVAQPLIPLSTMPTFIDGTLVPRHVDLRPFTLLGPATSYVTPGGLTRVARRSGSLIVNSSQGGGSKDTWVVDRVLQPPLEGEEEPRWAATEATPRTDSEQSTWRRQMQQQQQQQQQRQRQRQR